MEKYKHVHLWMILAFLLMQTGFIDSYWMTWKDEEFMRHIHALSAMGWYGLLISQPYLATRGKLTQHRTWGIIGFFLAGATAFTAIMLQSQNVEYGDRGGFGDPFNAAFFYGITGVELIMMTGFVIAVIMAIIKRKQTEDHAIWLITTVLYIMMPGLGRGIAIPFFHYFGPYNSMSLDITAIIIISALLIIGIRMKKLTHPAIILGVLVNIPSFFLIKMGEQEWYIRFIKGLIKYS